MSPELKPAFKSLYQRTSMLIGRIAGGITIETGDEAYEVELGDYDIVADSRESAYRCRVVLDAPSVNPEFKSRVLAFAVARRDSLSRVSPEAAANYDYVDRYLNPPQPTGF